MSILSPTTYLCRFITLARMVQIKNNFFPSSSQQNDNSSWGTIFMILTFPLSCVCTVDTTVSLPYTSPKSSTGCCGQCKEALGKGPTPSDRSSGRINTQDDLFQIHIMIHIFEVLQKITKKKHIK